MNPTAAEKLLEKADQAARSARLLLDSGDADGACNRAYYAMFDAARAVLLTLDPASGSSKSKTHRGLLNAFSEHLVKTGQFEPDTGRLLKRAEEIRLIADYNEGSVELEDARAMVDNTGTFLDAVRASMQT